MAIHSSIPIRKQTFSSEFYMPDFKETRKNNNIIKRPYIKLLIFILAIPNPLQKLQSFILIYSSSFIHQQTILSLFLHPILIQTDST